MMRRPTIAIYSTAIALLLAGSGFVSSCRHEAARNISPAATDNFPPEVSRIISTNCAVSGCHNAASYQVSGGSLLLDSWEHLFDGGAHGAVAIPYSPENSSLLYFINNYTDFGPVPADVNMKMPLNGTPLSREEYITMRNWIAEGAPDKNGSIPFATNADTRQKIYASHQGCDYVSVIDAEKNVVMRTIPIGQEVTIESAHSIKVSPDGYAYVSLWGSQYMMKIDTRTDSLVEKINLGSPNANMLFVSPNGGELLITSWYHNALLRMNTATKQTTASYGAGKFASPHGIASNRGFDTFFVTEQTGNLVYKIASSGSYKSISIDGRAPNTSSGPGPHNIMMAPDYSKYFLSCEGSNEIRVMDAYMDTLMEVIPVGKTPQEMVLSKDPATPYLFVTCLQDSNTVSVNKGSVYVINYNTNEVVMRIADRYYMPHGISIDDRRGMLYVFSRNIDPAGPVPHHSSSVCGGRSGFYSIYNIKTLQPLNNKRYEVTVDPYSADVRFK
jgi:DNA-binding beta-propeller fold protein YncE